MTRTVFEKADVIPMVAEVFRELGYEGASMSKITARTGLSKGSLYYFFPGGKEEMAAEILTHVNTWFAHNVFEPLEQNDPHAAIQQMWSEVDAYFRSGQRICLIGAFAIDETRNRFAARISQYFKRWIDALCGALIRAGTPIELGTRISEEVVSGIQGGLILARAINDEEIFVRTLTGLAERVAKCTQNGSQ
ncbi:TetR/AcrR family transcriptional regulator [Paenibacillus sp. 19GGS1-52]|uniref:TetR/AcrR family transcriptional regulator n=1 Tax=Paenibacillus sp. 19GGS1-52 TaxID=2758563 RepID=UPI0023BA429D|nr:TetR/AcrR family transcriptional regulator [Paenibacillus sp. 19GGS1-52]ULO07651.1 TetR/AcrR family transcriptional regulator [Paenibacillus sp. 19GGS1-52]